MPRPNAPWWLYLVASSFVGYFALLFLNGNFPPEGFGVFMEPRPGGVFVTRVAPGSPAEAAGVRAGDRAVADNGRAIRGELDQRVSIFNRAVGRPVVMEFEREGRHFTATHHANRRVFVGTSVRDNFPTLTPVVATVFLVTLLLALVAAFRRLVDPGALVGAWVLASIACTGAPVWPRGTAAAWRALPLPLGALLWPACLSSLSIGAVILIFFSIFPRRVFRRGWILPLALVPGAIVTLYAAVYLFLAVYAPDRALGYPTSPWMNYLGPLSFPAYMIAGAGVLAWNYRRLDDVNERRRVRLLLAGAALGGFGLLLIAIAFVFPIEEPVLLAGVVLFLALPSAFAYAMARHRLFDVRLILRQGLQYALARRVVLSVVPLVASLLVVDLLLHGDQPFIAILRARGWVYVSLAAFALIAHVQRHRWMDAIDKRFFRERYDAQRLMREVVDDIKGAGSITGAAPTVVARVSAALHPEFTALLLREPDDTHYRATAIAPAGHALPPLTARSKIVGLVRLLGKPLQVATAESGWLATQLPQEDTAFLREARIDLIVPVAVDPDRREALLVLGPKQSEEPYSGEELELLSAIGASLGLLAERPATQQGLPTFGECPQCGRCCDAGVARCPDDGVTLKAMRFSRTLVGRYALDRRLGRGGMGTVYEAMDTALQRQVAVKVIREDLIGQADAADRFRREARAAASFTHPHVVTIHDFGVTDEARAFLVMERLAGRTLREALRQEGRLAAPRTCEILRGVCAAADAAHRRQIIHRDLKPENIFLAREGGAETAKVLDFGIAKALPSAEIQPTADTGTGVLVGTLRYMAPEQIAGGAPTPLWDLWALAIVAYEMLTSAHPLADVRPVDWAEALRAERWTPIARHLAEAPPDLDAFFTRAFALDPAERPASAPRLLEQFEQALGSH